VKRIGFWDTMLLKPSASRLNLLQNQAVIMETGEAGDEKGSWKWFKGYHKPNKDLS